VKRAEKPKDTVVSCVMYSQNPLIIELGNGGIACNVSYSTDPEKPYAAVTMTQMPEEGEIGSYLDRSEIPENRPQVLVLIKNIKAGLVLMACLSRALNFVANEGERARVLKELKKENNL